MTNGYLIHDLHLFLICLLINSAVVILDFPLDSIWTEIVKQDKVKTFYIAIKGFLIGQGKLTTPESQALIFGLIFYVHLALVYLYLSLSW